MSKKKIGLVNCAQCGLVFDIMTINQWGICPNCERQPVKIGQGFFFDGTPYGEAECSIVVVTRIKDGNGSPYPIEAKFYGTTKPCQCKLEELSRLSSWAAACTGL